VHKRRLCVLRDDSGRLCVYVRHDEGRLHLLRSHEQYAGLLRLLSPITAITHESAFTEKVGDLFSGDRRGARW
jgi:hypothetical protein